MFNYVSFHGQIMNICPLVTGADSMNIAMSLN